MRKVYKGLCVPVLLFFAVLLSAAKPADTPSRLVDKNSGEAITLASITDRNGTMIAQTGNDGSIPEIQATAFPVTFSLIGYEPLEVDSLGGGDIALEPLTLQLSEVVVSPGEAPLMYITAYMREYASSFGSKDSLTIYEEGIVDFLIPVEKTKVKGWRKPRILASKQYQRHTDSAGLDEVSNQADDIFLMASNLNIFPSSEGSALNMPEKIASASGTTTETVFTKNNTKMDWQRNGDIIRLSHDIMTRYENHVYSPTAFKLLGATVDITESVGSYVFICGDGERTITPADLCQLSLSLKLTGRGKMFKWGFDSKSPVDIRNYIEIYVIDRAYVTEKEGKELKKNPPSVPAGIVAPKGTAPLHPGVERIVERVNGKVR